MDCTTSYDNRETCVNLVPSGCVPYTGHISDSIKSLLPDCKPNINDVLKALQTNLDKLNTKFGDNTTLDKKCFAFNPATVSQSQLNQLFINEICLLKNGTVTGGTVDANTLEIAINLLCVENPACDVQPTYTLQEVLEKLVLSYCNLLNRLTTIENLLNI